MRNCLFMVKVNCEILMLSGILVWGVNGWMLLLLFLGFLNVFCIDLVVVMCIVFGLVVVIRFF